MDQANWRASKLPPNAKINATMIRDQYRLKGVQLHGIPFIQTYVNFVLPGGYRPIKKEYTERDIEKRAWELHGGPEGFDAYLARLREDWICTRKIKPFPLPRTYNHACQYVGIPTQRARQNRLGIWDTSPGSASSKLDMIMG